MGSPRFQSSEVDGLRITRAWFPPGLSLVPHHHDRTCFAVILDGSMDCMLTGRTYECATDSVWIEPAGERHGNRFYDAGAHVIVVQPDSSREELFRPCAKVLAEPRSFEHAGIASIARGLVREMLHPDDLQPLALEASALEMLVSATRTAGSQSRASERPTWLRRVEEIIHDRFRERLEVRYLAAEVGVHPAHLGRVFRVHKRIPIATYIRNLRLEWAADQLRTTDSSLSHIALRAGFADQSHFTRSFKRHTGHPPGHFRSISSR